MFFAPEWVGFYGLMILLMLIFLRIPVGLAMIGVGIAGNYVLSLILPHFRFDAFLTQFQSLMWSHFASYNLSVIALFILMGFIAAQSQLNRDLFLGFHMVFGRTRGGVAIAAIGSCAGFGAICGSSLATASTMGQAALPELRRLGYAPWFAAATLAAGGTLGILIPPSIVLIVYAVIVDAGIITMFQAAILPGLMAVGMFILTAGLLIRFFPHIAPLVVKKSIWDGPTLWRLAIILTLFLGIIVGISLGFFTPTPAAGVGVVLVMLYGIARKKYCGEGLDGKGLKSALLDTSLTAGMIYFLIFGSEILKIFFTRAGIPALMAEFAQMSMLNPWLILGIVLVALILLGCMMESFSLILVAVPFFWPVLLELNGGDTVLAEMSAFGMDSAQLKVWFGILVLIVVELGLITPPLGLNIFILHDIAGNIPMQQIFKGVVPFIVSELIRIGLLLGFPVLVLLIPYGLP